MFGSRRRRAASNLVGASFSVRCVFRFRVTLAVAGNLVSSIYVQELPTKSLLTHLVIAAQWYQCQSFCDVRGSPGLHEEPSFERITLLGRSGCCIAIQAYNSNICGRCTDKKDSPKARFKLISRKLCCWIISTTTERKFWIDVRADIPGSVTISIVTGTQRD